MLLRRTILTTFIVALTILTVFSGLTTAIAETSKEYMLKISARKVKPNDRVQVTIRSAKPGEVLFMVVVDEEGNPINTPILAVYKGVVAQAGHLIIVKTDTIDALAIFCIRAPSKPGAYTIKLYDPIGKVGAEEQMFVEWTIQQLLGRPEVVIVGLLILAVVLASVYLFILTPA